MDTGPKQKRRRAWLAHVSWIGALAIFSVAYGLESWRDSGWFGIGRAFVQIAWGLVAVYAIATTLTVWAVGRTVLRVLVVDAAWVLVPIAAWKVAMQVSETRDAAERERRDEERRASLVVPPPPPSTGIRGQTRIEPTCRGCPPVKTRPLAGVAIAAVSDAGAFKTTSDSSGMFYFELAPGCYELTFSFPGTDAPLGRSACVTTSVLELPSVVQTIESPPADGGAPIVAAVPCPASFSASLASQASCGMRASKGLATCTFPEWTCACAPDDRDTSPMPQPSDVALWSCTRNVAPAAPCPPAYAAVTWGECGMRASKGLATCAYPEGTCTCAPMEHCGGPMPPPPEPTDPAFWRCKPKVAPDAGLGCPPDPPLHGGPCGKQDVLCNYPDTCAMSARCTNGQWSVAGSMRP